MDFNKLDFKPDKWQIDFINTEGDKILASGRQVGKSVICSIDAGEWAIKQDKPKNVLMIAPTERQAYALFEKTLRYLVKYYPKQIKKGKEKPTQSRISLINGVNIYCLPVGISGVGIRFITIGRLYVDEASRVNRDVFDAVTPALLTTGGDTILLSTFDGADPENEFHNTWINRDGAYDSFTRFAVSSVDVIKERELCESWTEKQREKALEKIEQARARMSEKMFAQEYLGIPHEDLLNFFPNRLIEKCCILNETQKIDPYPKFMGVDIARLGDDKTSISIVQKVNRDMFQQIRCITTEKQLLTQTFDLILQLQREYNCKQIGIDAGSGSLGVGLLDFMLREPKLASRVVALNNRKRALDADGKEKGKLLKEDMYFNLLAMMEKGRIQLLRDDKVILSLRSVKYETILTQKGQTLKVFSHIHSDIIEGLIRACQLANETKTLNLFATSSTYGQRRY